MRTIRIDGEIGWNVNAAYFSAELGSGSDDVLLIINSAGGSILEGFSIYNAIKEYPGRVVARVDLAASMASVIALAADSVEMSPNSSIFMIHRAWSCACGTAEDLRSIAEDLEKLGEMLINIYLEKVDGAISREELEEYLDSETYFTAQEALEAGLIDEILEDSKPSNMLKMSLAALSSKNVDFDRNKLVAKINEVSQGQNRKQKVTNQNTLKGIEQVLKNEFSMSDREAVAVIGAVKKATGATSAGSGKCGDDPAPSDENITALESAFENIIDHIKRV